MLWWVPPWNQQVHLAIYYSIAYILYDTAFTLVAVPYSALTPELTEDYDERTSLNGYSQAVSIAGGLIAAVAVPLLMKSFPDKKAGILAAGIIFAISAFIPYIILFFTIEERFPHAKPISFEVIPALRYTLKNKSFLYASGIFLTAWAAVNLVGTELLYYLKYLMNMEGDFEVILGLLMGSGLACTPLVVWLCKKLGKQKAYVVSMSWWVIMLFLLTILPAGSNLILFYLAISAGLGIAAAHVIPSAINPDVIEADELATGYRREATFYGILVFLQKVGTAIMLAFAQFILAQTGYISDAVQNQETIMAIRIIVGVLPALLILISIWLAWKFPINRVKHKQMRAELIKRRAQLEEL
jgi:GPH family glycoside/pentoside/hexuronide:cation symporter